MKTRAQIIAALIAISTPLCQARLGETEDELVKRYGPSQCEADESGARRCYFAHNRFSVSVYLLDGQSVSETFEEVTLVPIRGQPPARKFTEQVSDGTREVVLGANSRGKTWEPVSGLEWLGARWAVGSNHPYTSDYLLSAWELAGESDVCYIHRPAALGKLGTRITVATKRWSNFAAAAAKKEHDKKIKASGL
jgi:hypothetical protein